MSDLHIENEAPGSKIVTPILLTDRQTDTYTHTHAYTHMHAQTSDRHERLRDNYQSFDW